MTKQDLYDILSHAPDSRAVNSTEICTRCFICGDSSKNVNKKRLYIKVDPNNPKEPALYWCFNCYAKGVFTANMLKDMGIDNSEASTFIRKLNHDATNDDGSRVNKYRNTKEIKLEFPQLKGDRKTLLKIKYLYDRIGYKIPPEDFNRLKIVFNIKEFLELNNIEPNNKHIDLLDNDYVGFLSIHNEYIILRDITGQNRMRYVKYNIFNVVDNSNSFYAARASLDLMIHDDIHMIVAEGPFDILGIIYNIYNGDFSNKIFVASCDGSLMNPILSFIRKGIVGDNIFIDCYQDNDTRLNFKKIKRELNMYTPNFTVYYNRISKDFGVPKEKIDRDVLII